MIEDEVYRTSSQYRYWSYTRGSLASLRQATNDLASERVKEAIRRSQSNTHKARNGIGNGFGESEEGGQEHPTIETLTVQEELKIVRWGCSMIIEMGARMQPQIPPEVTVCSPTLA